MRYTKKIVKFLGDGKKKATVLGVYVMQKVDKRDFKFRMFSNRVQQGF